MRSTTRLENVVDRYAPLTAAYQPKLTTAPPATTTNAHTPGRSRSARGTASIARSAIAGRMPIPIAKAPPAQLPYSTIRPFQRVVAVDHSFERCPRNATIATTAPTPSTTAPTQSQRDQAARQRRSDSVRQASATSPKPSAPKSATSCERTSTASRHDANARAIGHRPGRSTARTTSQSAIVDAGYAHGSSTRIGEYESAGPAIAATAAKYAQPGDSRRRARRNAGKIAPAITNAWTLLIASYAVATGWSHHSGAVSQGTRLVNPYGSPRRAAWPVSAIAREIWVVSSSSEKIVGVSRRQACHA